jgi:hypothetical protein
MFDKERNDERFPLRTRCILIINGSKHTCLVNDISTLGALVEVSSTYHNKIQLGDMGTLSVLLLSFVTYPCEVIRIIGNKIALHFLEQ